MFSIVNGNKGLYQWDLNREIIVADSSIKEVHYTNSFFGEALVVEVKNGVAAIPNILLQQSGQLKVYAYTGMQTRFDKTFEIKSRLKPQTYFYTETEIKNYQTLLDQINKIDNSLSDKVKEYFEKNPPTVELEGMATEDFVREQLVDYAKKNEIPSIAGLATETFVNEQIAAIPAPDLSEYAKKNEIPSTIGLATEQYVNEKVAAVPQPDLSGYAKKDEVPSVEGLTSEAKVNEMINSELVKYQPKLTAGENITIKGNVISATGGGSGGGSVSVDGTTIIQNDDGTISTAFGKGYMYVDSDSLIREGNTLTATPTRSIVFGSGNNIIKNSWGKLSNSIVIGNNNSFNGGDMNSNSIYLGNNNTVVNMGGILVGDNCTMYAGMDDYNSSSNIMVGSHLLNNRPSGFCALFGINGRIQENQMLAVAYGTSNSDAPVFSVSQNGNVNANGTISGGGSDYAEYFEWQDGNPEGEDRVGLIVSLRGDKIVLAQDGDYVLGVISGTATVLGDNAEYTWSKIHARDDFGRVIYEDIEIEYKNGSKTLEKHPKMNPAYHPKEEYIARSKRKEWDVVGMLGKLYVRDDGTCGEGGYAKVGADGIATLSQEPTNMYVMKRTTANIVRVLFK